jgi:hypothetical protein
MSDDGKELLVIEENMVGNERVSIGGVGARQGVVAADTAEYKNGKPGGFEPHQRISGMDADGIDQHGVSAGGALSFYAMN